MVGLRHCQEGPSECCRRHYWAPLAARRQPRPRQEKRCLSRVTCKRTSCEYSPPLRKAARPPTTVGNTTIAQVVGLKSGDAGQCTKDLPQGPDKPMVGTLRCALPTRPATTWPRSPC